MIEGKCDLNQISEFMDLYQVHCSKLKWLEAYIPRVLRYATRYHDRPPKIILIAEYVAVAFLLRTMYVFSSENYLSVANSYKIASPRPGLFIWMEKFKAERL